MKKAICGIVVLAVLSSACSSVSGIRDEPLTAGRVRTYEALAAAVEKAAREAMVESGLVIEESFRTDGGALVIIGKAETSAFSWGELVRVVVQGRTNEQVIVRVLTKRKLATNVTAKGDHSDPIFSGIAAKLEGR